MPVSTTLAAFTLTALVIELTPGPNMAYLALIAATEGRKPGYAAVAGVALGLTVVGLAAALGLTAVINASPIAYQILLGAELGICCGWRGMGGVARRQTMTSPKRDRRSRDFSGAA